MSEGELNFRRVLSASEPTLFSLHHPRMPAPPLLVLYNGDAWAQSDLSLFLACIFRDFGLCAPLNLCLQLGLSACMLVLFLTLYLLPQSKGDEDWLIDLDFMLSTTTAEAEKEVFSMEDASSVVLLLFIFFACYFGFFVVNGCFVYLEYLSIMLPVPLVLMSLLTVPLNLLLDFGLCFVAYLRGASNTGSLFLELVYDYIGVVAFFTRLCVQVIRILLMAVVYVIMHDVVVVFYVPQRASLYGDSFWEELTLIEPTLGSLTFFFLIVLPARLAYWTYEVLHTFFVVTAQFAAFFTIVFWLFLLFYSFFVLERVENHLSQKREARRKAQERDSSE